MAHKQKPGAEIGSLQQLGQKWRAYATGKEGREYTPLRNTKEEALADLTKARENAIDSTDVARGLAAVRSKKLAAKTACKKKARELAELSKKEACCQD